MTGLWQVVPAAGIGNSQKVPIFSLTDEKEGL